MLANIFNKRCKPETFDHARKMRAHPTESEAKLWEAIRKQKLGANFCRQVVILGWIVDFYCPRQKLIVEVDGGYHREFLQKLDDSYRDWKMREHGFLVVRVNAEDVLSRLPHVLETIQIKLKRTKSKRSVSS